MKLKRKTNRNGYLELTPLVDVVFLLLTFYMLTSTFVKEKQLRLNLPKAKNASEEIKNLLEITLLKDNKIILEGKSYTNESLSKYLKDRLSSESNALIRADRDNTLDNLVSLVDSLKSIGVRKISLGTSN